jgi:hypothetical protein
MLKLFLESIIAPKDLLSVFYYLIICGGLLFPYKGFKPFIGSFREVACYKKHLIIFPSRLALVNINIGYYLGKLVPKLQPGTIKRLWGLDLKGLGLKPVHCHGLVPSCTIWPCHIACSCSANAPAPVLLPPLLLFCHRLAYYFFCYST